MKDKFNNWFQKDPSKVIKIGAICFVIFMAISILASYFLFSKFNPSNNSETKKTTKETTKETEITYEKIGLKELSEEESEKQYNTLIKLAENGKWSDISESITKLREKNNLSTEYNQKIINLYLDASIMIQLELSTQDANIDAITFSNIHDENMKALGFLYLKSNVQAYVMNLGDYKLCPEKITSAKILEIKDFDMTKPNGDVVIESLKIKEANQDNVISPEGYKYSVDDVKKIIRYKILANETEIYVYIVPRNSNVINIDSVTYVNENDSIISWHQSSYFLSEILETNPETELNETTIPETSETKIMETEPLIEETQKEKETESETQNISETTKEKVISF